MATPVRPQNPEDVDQWHKYLDAVSKGSSYPEIAEAYGSFFEVLPQCYYFYVLLSGKAHSMEGSETAIAVFEQGVKSTPYDYALWKEYIKYMTDNTLEGRLEVLRRAVATVGWDWQAKEMWSQFMEALKVEEPESVGAVYIDACAHGFSSHAEFVTEANTWAAAAEGLDSETKEAITAASEVGKAQVAACETAEGVIAGDRTFFHPSPVSDDARAAWMSLIDHVEAALAAAVEAEADVAGLIRRALNMYGRALVVLAKDGPAWDRFLTFVTTYKAHIDETVMAWAATQISAHFTPIQRRPALLGLLLKLEALSPEHACPAYKRATAAHPSVCGLAVATAQCMRRAGEEANACCDVLRTCFEAQKPALMQTAGYILTKLGDFRLALGDDRDLVIEEVVSLAGATPANAVIHATASWAERKGMYFVGAVYDAMGVGVGELVQRINIRCGLLLKHTESLRAEVDTAKAREREAMEDAGAASERERAALVGCAEAEEHCVMLSSTLVQLRQEAEEQREAAAAQAMEARVRREREKGQQRRVLGGLEALIREQEEVIVQCEHRLRGYEEADRERERAAQASFVSGAPFEQGHLPFDESVLDSQHDVSSGGGDTGIMREETPVGLTRQYSSPLRHVTRGVSVSPPPPSATRGEGEGGVSQAAVRRMQLALRLCGARGGGSDPTLARIGRLLAGALADIQGEGVSLSASQVAAEGGVSETGMEGDGEEGMTETQAAEEHPLPSDDEASDPDTQSSSEDAYLNMSEEEGESPHPTQSDPVPVPPSFSLHDIAQMDMDGGGIIDTHATETETLEAREDTDSGHGSTVKDLAAISTLLAEIEDNAAVHQD
ncbi:hypothetical protein KIPB_001209 [Kipferlia bialata]|uniref:Suppressor of forked domain-containing protein n=1 Tax=Kipferlia bialata TaxID=797122 RepID=A0A391NIK8_9EUKA|nr:hypothetical protein KIPB_001209 [Kipferlia bialata]|eukprot:g1209.t1